MKIKLIIFSFFLFQFISSSEDKYIEFSLKSESSIILPKPFFLNLTIGEKTIKPLLLIGKGYNIFTPSDNCDKTLICIDPSKMKKLNKKINDILLFDMKFGGNLYEHVMKLDSNNLGNLTFLANKVGLPSSFDFLVNVGINKIFSGVFSLSIENLNQLKINGKINNNYISISAVENDEIKVIVGGKKDDKKYEIIGSCKMNNSQFNLTKVYIAKKEEIIKNAYKAILDLNELIELSFALPPEIMLGSKEKIAKIVKFFNGSCINYLNLGLVYQCSPSDTIYFNIGDKLLGMDRLILIALPDLLSKSFDHILIGPSKKVNYTFDYEKNELNYFSDVQSYVVNEPNSSSNLGIIITIIIIALLIGGGIGVYFFVKKKRININSGTLIPL